jgi:hypothetical protein
VKAPLAAAFLAAALAAPVHAAPKAGNALECGIAADMAVVAHSLAREEIQRPKANQIMARIYEVAESERARELMKEILDAAYASRSASAQQFAEELFSVCMKSGGDMDPVLGRRL